MSESVVMIAPAPYVLMTTLAPTITGISLKAMRHKISRGQWLLGREYVKGPDGLLYLSLKGYSSWVESANAG